MQPHIKQGKVCVLVANLFLLIASYKCVAPATVFFVVTRHPYLSEQFLRVRASTGVCVWPGREGAALALSAMLRQPLTNVSLNFIPASSSYHATFVGECGQCALSLFSLSFSLTFILLWFTKLCMPELRSISFCYGAPTTVSISFSDA